MSPLADIFIPSDLDGPPDHVYMEDSPVMSPLADIFIPSDGPPDHVYLEDSSVTSPLASADNFIPSDYLPDHLDLEDSPVMSPLADIFIPLDGLPDHVYLEDSPTQHCRQSADSDILIPDADEIYIPASDDEETAGTATAAGPSGTNRTASADIADFDIRWLEDSD